MRVVGVDLAWGVANRTGVCVVEGDTVLASASLTTDDAIVEWIEAWAAPSMVVAIDAPLIVENAGGSRACDALVSSAYGARHAGALPANRSLPAFRDGGRARRLAARLGLGVDPLAARDPRARVAIEVYPHAALVSLFGLPRSLGYKAKVGRSRPQRAHAFATFLALLESLRDRAPALDVTTSPRWPALCETLARAASGAALDRVEDELDAYVCAYAGLYHRQWLGGKSVVVGDTCGGYIVIPADGECTALRERARRVGVAVA